jgi:hypothetical protein
MLFLFLSLKSIMKTLADAVHFAPTPAAAFTAPAELGEGTLTVGIVKR